MEGGREGKGRSEGEGKLTQGSVLDAFRFKRDQEYREIVRMERVERRIKILMQTKRELWRFLEGDVRTEGG